MKAAVNLMTNWMVFLVSAVWLGVFLYTDLGSSLHGFVFPTVTQLEIESIEPYDYNGLDASIISGSADKLRNCDFVGMDWFTNADSVQGTIESFFLDPPQGRSSGRQYWSAIVVGIDINRVVESISYVHHACSFSLPVKTKFFG